MVTLRRREDALDDDDTFFLLVLLFLSASAFIRYEKAQVYDITIQSPSPSPLPLMNYIASSVKNEPTVKSSERYKTQSIKIETQPVSPRSSSRETQNSL